MGKIEILCLGTGDAESALYENVNCTAFCVLLDGYPTILMGCGPGVLRAVTHYAHLVPECVLLLNASLEQCHDLSPLVLFETLAKRRIRIFASRPVCTVVSELLRLQLQDRLISPELVNLVVLPTAAADGDFFSVVHEFSVLLHSGSGQAEGSFVTSSAVLCFRDQPIVSATGPVAFDAILYSKLCHAPYVVCWASVAGGPHRATIQDVAAFSDKINVGRKSDDRALFLVCGYGTPQDAPMITGYVTLLQQGSPIVLLAGDFVMSPFAPLNLPLPNVRKAPMPKLPLSGKTTIVNFGGDAQPAASFHVDPSHGAAAVAAASGSAPSSARPTPLTMAALHAANTLDKPLNPAALDYFDATDNIPVRPGASDTRKIFVFTNDDKGAAGKLLLCKNFRTLPQIALRVAAILHLKPLKDFYFPSGAVVRSMDELRDGCEIVAVRRGGAPFAPGDLPRLMKAAARQPPNR
jgi:hypothetical protein